MPQGKRRPWRDPDNTLLIALWQTVGSVALIAIMMRRTPSSVQTQASRLGLPPRAEESDRHRRRWTEAEDRRLDALLAELARPDGTIPIQDVAERMDRSVDAVVARIEARQGEDSDIMDRLVAPPMPTQTSPGEAPKTAPQDKPPEAVGSGKPAKTTGKTRKCLRCRKSFWSSGNWNWVCGPCKRSDDWDCD